MVNIKKNYPVCVCVRERERERERDRQTERERGEDSPERFEVVHGQSITLDPGTADELS